MELGFYVKLDVKLLKASCGLCRVACFFIVRPGATCSPDMRHTRENGIQRARSPSSVALRSSLKAHVHVGGVGIGSPAGLWLCMFCAVAHLSTRISINVSHINQ